MNVHLPKNKTIFTKYPKFMVIFIILLGICFFTYNLCFIYIKPNIYGIKKVNIGFKRGLKKKVYTTGLNFVLPFGIEEMFLLPKNIQVLEMTEKRNEGYGRRRFVDYNREYQKSIHIQTSDGFFVDLDVSILYKIIDPYKIISKIGPGNLFISNGILPKAEPVLKEALGVLTTEEFYNSHSRVEAVSHAKELLQKELEPKGLRVEQILVRYFKYSDEIQKNIEEKKLKDQLVFKNMAEAKASAEEVKLKEAIEEGKAAVKVKLQEGKAYIMEKNAEKELYIRKKKADANLLIKLAEAKKIELRNEAFSSVGSDKRVGLAMAEVYKGIQLIILPSTGENGFNPLDLDSVIKSLGIKND